ncbi:alpha/beta hydrolase family protein [Spongiimicrobium salis]|uniref:alpha/beta hydrolase family protein n=1 Tax=Spongiimicrobium salis TaxID=1667022 RepID=UPI00374C8996
MGVKRNIAIAGKHRRKIVLDMHWNDVLNDQPIVVFCHGYKGFKDWGCWDLVAQSFAKAGFCFVKFNFSYNGGTVEEPIDFPDLEAFGQNNFSKELDDLEVVIDWLMTATFPAEIPLNTSKIILIGHSRGGIVTIKAAEDKRIAKVLSWAGVSDFRRMLKSGEALEQWRKDGVMYVVNGRTKQKMPHYYQFYEDFEANETRLTIKNAVDQLHIPHCIIHGNADESVPLSEGERLHAWNSKSKFEIINGANHVFGGKHPWNEESLPLALTEVVQKSISFIQEV